MHAVQVLGGWVCRHRSILMPGATVVTSTHSQSAVTWLLVPCRKALEIHHTLTQGAGRTFTCSLTYTPATDAVGSSNNGYGSGSDHDGSDWLQPPASVVQVTVQEMGRRWVVPQVLGAWVVFLHNCGYSSLAGSSSCCCSAIADTLTGGLHWSSCCLKFAALRVHPRHSIR